MTIVGSSVAAASVIIKSRTCCAGADGHTDEYTRENRQEERGL
jgi:hypothetical protein